MPCHRLLSSPPQSGPRVLPDEQPDRVEWTGREQAQRCRPSAHIHALEQTVAVRHALLPVVVDLNPEREQSVQNGLGTADQEPGIAASVGMVDGIKGRIHMWRAHTAQRRQDRWARVAQQRNKQRAAMLSARLIALHIATTTSQTGRLR